jgi:hypothetical protein
MRRRDLEHIIRTDPCELRARGAFVKTLARALAVLAAAALPACSTTHASPPSSADASPDASADADAATACPGSLAAWCADELAAGPCPGSWNAILALEPSCTATSPLAADHISMSPCDGYDVYVETRADAFYTFYFDPSTGAPVAASYAPAGGGEARCVGGPAGFTPPACTTLRPLCQPMGLDGGDGGG